MAIIVGTGVEICSCVCNVCLVPYDFKSTPFLYPDAEEDCWKFLREQGWVSTFIEPDNRVYVMCPLCQTALKKVMADDNNDDDKKIQEA